MRELITFYLSVKYTAPSKERLFLKKNWGISDVRGPYLNSLQGFICIDNTMFSPEVPSTISLVFSVSNRCPTASISTRISTQKEEFTQDIAKNGSKEFTIGSVYSSSQREYVVSVCLPDVRTATDHKKFLDILAIDEISIERHR